jgi:hypothetical protein
MGFNPFKLILSGGKAIFKGFKWVMNRPETSFAALVLPGLGYVKAAMVLKYMMQAEDLLGAGTGPQKLSWVMNVLRQLEQDKVITIGLNDGELGKYIASLVPVVEGRAILTETEPDTN